MSREKGPGSMRNMRKKSFAGVVSIAVAVLLLVGGAGAAWAKKSSNPCKSTARKMFNSCRAEVQEEAQVCLANCINLATKKEREECKSEVEEIRAEDRAGCTDQREGRVDVCELLDEERYDTEPLTDESLEFVDPDSIGNENPPNPFFSLEAKRTHVLRAGEGFEETVIVHVTDEAREILGQPCRIVVDAVVLREETSKGIEYEPVEVTDDWYAQERNGDIYYCGELSRNFEDGILRDLDGSFEAGIDSAKSGTLIKAMPEIDDAHRQEFFLGEAEDVIRYEEASADVPPEEGGDNPGFPCASSCLKTEEFVPPEPGVAEFEYYREGIGFVLGVSLEDGEPTGERDELVCYGDSLEILQDPACGIEDPDALLESLCVLAPSAFCVD